MLPALSRLYLVCCDECDSLKSLFRDEPDDLPLEFLKMLAELVWHLITIPRATKQRKLFKIRFANSPEYFAQSPLAIVKYLHIEHHSALQDYQTDLGAIFQT